MATHPDLETEPAPAPVLEQAELIQYYDYENRLSSFDNWPIVWEIARLKPLPTALARAGFFYYPNKPNLADNVACPYCHLFLDTLEPRDDPMQIHKERAPMCRFVLEVEVRNGETIICRGLSLWNVTKEADLVDRKNSHTVITNKKGRKKGPKVGGKPCGGTKTTSSQG